MSAASTGGPSLPVFHDRHLRNRFPRQARGHRRADDPQASLPRRWTRGRQRQAMQSLNS